MLSSQLSPEGWPCCLSHRRVSAHIGQRLSEHANRSASPRRGAAFEPNLPGEMGGWDSGPTPAQPRVLLNCCFANLEG